MCGSKKGSLLLCPKGWGPLNRIASVAESLLKCQSKESLLESSSDGGRAGNSIHRARTVIMATLDN